MVQSKRINVATMNLLQRQVKHIGQTPTQQIDFGQPPSNPIKKLAWKFAWWLAIKTGAKQVLEMNQAVEFSRVDINYDGNVQEQLIELIEAGEVELEDRLAAVLVGRNFYLGLQAEVYRQPLAAFFEPPLGIHGPRVPRFLGVAVIMVPWMEGICPLTQRQLDEIFDQVSHQVKR